MPDPGRAPLELQLAGAHDPGLTPPPHPSTKPFRCSIHAGLRIPGSICRASRCVGGYEGRTLTTYIPRRFYTLHRDVCYLLTHPMVKTSQARLRGASIDSDYTPVHDLTSPAKFWSLACIYERSTCLYPKASQLVLIAYSLLSLAIVEILRCSAGALVILALDCRSFSPMPDSKCCMCPIFIARLKSILEAAYSTFPTLGQDTHLGKQPIWLCEGRQRSFLPQMPRYQEFWAQYQALGCSNQVAL